MDTDFQTQHIQLAVLDTADRRTLQELQAKRAALYAEHLKDLDAEIAALEKGLGDRVAQFKADLLAYFMDTGDRSITEGMPGVEIRTRTTEITYDEDKVIPLLQAHKPEFLRQSVRKTDFKKFWKVEHPVWAEGLVEPVNTHHVEVGKLGDIAILAEAGRLGELVAATG